MSQRLDGALRELRRGVSAVPDPESDSVRRDRVAARVLEVQRDLMRRDRSRRRAVGALLAAAAVVVAVVLLLRPRSEPDIAMAPERALVHVVSGRVSVQDASGVTSVDRGDVSVARDAVVATEREAASLRLMSRAALALSSATEVSLSVTEPRAGARRERVRLISGRVDLDVPKLGPGEELAIETREAVVEVRGTRFSVSRVEREPPHAASTRVDVSEGKVRIQLRDGVRELAAGQSWRSDAEAAESAAPSSPRTTAVPEPTAAPAPREPAAASRRPAAQRAEPAPSELAAQNRLLEAAQLAKRSKMPELALERLERLLALHPGSDLAHNARVERFRLLAEMGRRDEARASAREYLEAHPRGFARSEAVRLLEGESAGGP